MIVDDTALREAIAKANASMTAAWHAVTWVNEGDDDFAELLAEYRVASARHAALIEAGVLMTLGPIGDEDEKPR